MRLVSAGHDPILAYNPRTDAFQELGGSDPPLGFEQACTFHEHAYPLEEGLVLVLGTDGIWETFSPAGEPFGFERLKQTIRAHADANAMQINQAILDAVKRFRRAAPQDDDVTAVVVKVVPLATEHLEVPRQAAGLQRR